MTSARPRRPTSRSESSRSKTPHPSRTQLQRIYSLLRRKPNVIACYLGFRHTRGRRQKSIAVVCLVKQKVGHRRLSARSRIPRKIVWLDAARRRHEIPTDVVAMRGDALLCASSCGPGDGIRGVENGSIGMAIGHPRLGSVVTTAGHCALRADEGAGIYDFSAQPRQVTLTNSASGIAQAGSALQAACTVLCDYALVRPADPSSCTNFFRNGIRVLTPAPGDPQLGSAVLLLTSTSAPRSATVTGIHAEMPIGKAGVMYQLILTTPTLIGGDSGGLLITADRKALGLAVGFVPVDSRRVISVFMRADFVLDREAAVFI